MGIKISQLPSGSAEQTAVAPATNAAGTQTSKVTLMGIASLATKQTVGLGNVDNTSDANKPVSSAQQTALDLKAPLASPNFTGTVNGITSSMVGLGNVDNTSDANKPVSSAQQTALDGKASSSHNHDRLTNNDKEIILGSNGSLTFPDGAVQASAGITDSSQDGITYARKDGNWINVASSASLQVSRGTEAQRIAVVPLEGEPVYTTDSKRLYVGDGVTLGGVDILSQTNLASPTAIITGFPIRPLNPVNVILPPSKVLMPDGTYVSCSGKWISTFVSQSWPPYRNKEIEENRIIGFESDVEGIIGGCFNSVSTSSTFLSLNLPNLKFVWGNFGASSLSTLNILNLSNLTMVSNNFTLTNDNLTSLSLPALKIVNGNMSLTSTSIASLSLPELTYANNFTINLQSLTSLSLNSLEGVGSFAATLPLLISLSISSLQSNDGSLSLSSSFLSTLTLPASGVWKSCAGINITTGSLDQTTVNTLLDRLAYMDGNNNTSLFGATKSANISGGTNAAPSNAGSVSVTLQTSPTLPNIACVGTTCTINLTNHGYSSGDVLKISGVTTATNANRYAAITVTDANQFTYGITSQTAFGAGTATIIKAGDSVKTLVARGVTLTTN